MPRTGDVVLRDYDEGIMGLLGASIAAGPDGKNAYWVPVDHWEMEYERGVSGKVRSYVIPPEATVRKYILPSILVRRGNLEPATDRWHGPGCTQYKIPASNAQKLTVEVPDPDTQAMVDVTGYSQYEEKPQAMPYDIPYDIQIIARYRDNAEYMWNWVMRKLNGSSGVVFYVNVPVLDSEGDTRHYVGVVTPFELNGEVSDVLRRRHICMIGIRVMGELDFGGSVVELANTGGLVLEIC